MQFITMTVSCFLLSVLVLSLSSLNGVFSSKLSLADNSENKFETWRVERSPIEDVSEMSAFGPNEAAWNLAQTSFKWEELTRQMMKSGNSIK